MRCSQVPTCPPGGELVVGWQCRVRSGDCFTVGTSRASPGSGGLHRDRVPAVGCVSCPARRRAGGRLAGCGYRPQGGRLRDPGSPGWTVVAASLWPGTHPPHSGPKSSCGDFTSSTFSSVQKVRGHCPPWTGRFLLASFWAGRTHLSSVGGIALNDGAFHFFLCSTENSALMPLINVPTDIKTHGEYM